MKKAIVSKGYDFVGLIKEIKGIVHKALYVAFTTVNTEMLKAYYEIGFWWINNTPTSTIGILRVKGLLAVGKMPQNGRMYKVALIPEDIREGIKKIFEA